jgi:hypothetical protein
MLSTDENSSAPQPVLQTVVDHPGGDVGSPGFVPGSGPITLPGDFNGDDRVDAADYVVWRKTDGTTAKYNEWRGNFGATAGAGSGLGIGGAVAEPGGAVLLMAGFAALCAYRPGQRRSIAT